MVVVEAYFCVLKNDVAIDESYNDDVICNSFLEIFSSISRKVDNIASVNFRNNFNDMFENYSKPECPFDLINVELVSNLIMKLELGKSQGPDGIAADAFSVFVSVCFIGSSKTF